MTDRLQIVPIQVDDESAIITWMVVHSDPGRTVIARARCDDGLGEGVDLRGALSGKRNVQRPERRFPSAIASEGL